MERTEICEKACDILRLTNDGDNLSSHDLRFIEIAVNNGLNEKGITYLNELLEKANKGYERPYHYGVEHITKDVEGFIYYKGIHVEHFSHRDSEQERKATLYLKKCCELLERNNIEVNSSSAVWAFDRYLLTMSEDDQKEYQDYQKELYEGATNEGQ